MNTITSGVYPVFQTPFTDEEAVDLEALESEIDWIAAQGAAGVTFGMVSEVLRLTDSERREIIEVASARAARHGIGCVASIGAESTIAALARLEAATAAGASAVMVTPPLLAANTENALEDYFTAILSSSRVPVVIQDASSYAGQPLSIDLQAGLFREFGEHVMFKPEAVPITPTLTALMAATDGAATVFEGMGGAALLESYPAGISGSMPGAEVCWSVIALWNALQTGDIAAGRAIERPLKQMLELQTDIDSFVVCEKFLLHEQGVLSNQTARSPLTFALTEESEHLLRSLLSELSEAAQVVTP